MRVAVIADIHGNLPALEAVLAEIEQASVDRIVCAGDVMPGPMVNETLTRLQAVNTPIRFITGNGDRVALAHQGGEDVSHEVPAAFMDTIAWSASQLAASQAAWIRGWPATYRFDQPGIGRVLVCHATPRNDTEIFTRLTDEARLRPIFEAAQVDVVVCGHTHMQFDRIVGNVRIVNAGSVGMPFGDPGAYWLLLGPGVELKRTAYDLERAADRIRSSGYPQAEQFAATNILKPPSEEQMLAAFGGAELK